MKDRSCEKVCDSICRSIVNFFIYFKLISIDTMEEINQQKRSININKAKNTY